MEVEDLRIGNLVEKNGDIRIVASIHSDSTIRVFNNDKTDTWGCFVLRIFKPITLTEEWLIKFGFKLYPSGYYCLDLTKDFYLSYGKDYDTELYLCVNYDDNNTATNINHIKHVHQLQNLYFALTGEQLTLKQ